MIIIIRTYTSYMHKYAVRYIVNHLKKIKNVRHRQSHRRSVELINYNITAWNKRNIVVRKALVRLCFNFHYCVTYSILV